jgi:hypothetical protein
MTPQASSSRLKTRGGENLLVEAIDNEKEI